MKTYKISLFKLPKILSRAREEATKEMKKAKTCIGMGDVIKKLGKEYKLAIISSNSKENIETFLKNNGLKFDIVIAEKNLFGKAKIIKKLLKEQKIKQNETVYIGDELRDIEEAGKAGVKVISVSWGYNKKEVLEKRNKLIADEPKDIPRLINEIISTF
jgi:phosphoglycolate phosphatase